MKMSMRQCARYIGIPYQTFCNYWLRIQDESLYEVVGSAKLVDVVVIKRMLLDAGYKFKNTGSMEIADSADEQAIYTDPQTMLEDIESGKLSEDEKFEE